MGKSLYGTLRTHGLGIFIGGVGSRAGGEGKLLRVNRSSLKIRMKKEKRMEAGPPVVCL